METGEPIIVPDIGKEPRFLNRTKARGDIKKEQYLFYMRPCKVHNDVVGVLAWTSSLQRMSLLKRM